MIKRHENEVTLIATSFPNIQEVKFEDDYYYVVKDKDELKNIIKTQKYELNRLITTFVADMSCLFHNLELNDDISSWDVSNVKNMACLFSGSNFNGDISYWDVGKVKKYVMYVL